jgi:hypothetical protein
VQLRKVARDDGAIRHAEEEKQGIKVQLRKVERDENSGNSTSRDANPSSPQGFRVQLRKVDPSMQKGARLLK